jgi:hypothetical protein
MGNRRLTKIFVSNSAFLVSLIGCGSGPSGPVPPAPGKIYVSNSATSSILRFDGAPTLNGDVVPGGVISGAGTNLNSPSYIFIDTTNDRLYIANYGGSSIEIYENASTQSGSIPPDRELYGSLTQLSGPFDVAVDTTRDILYVSDSSASCVLVWDHASTVNGNIAPSRQFTGSMRFRTNQGMYLDTQNDRLYVSDMDNEQIVEFDHASTENVGAQSTRVLMGDQTQLSQPDSVLVDSTDRLIVANRATGMLTIYLSASTIDGNVAPTVVFGGDNSGFIEPYQMVIDMNYGALFLADPFTPVIDIFNLSGLSGDVAPSRTISGPDTLITGSTSGTPVSVGVAVDSTR